MNRSVWLFWLRCGLLFPSVLVLFVGNVSHAVDSVAPREIEIVSAKFGFQGKFKVGCWTPAWIEFSGVESDLTGVLELTMLDGEGQPATYRFDDIDLSFNQPVALCYVKFGRVQSSVRVEFTADDGERVSRQFGTDDFLMPLPTSKQLVVTLGDSVDVQEALAERSRRTNESIEHAVVSSLDELPDHWVGYSSVDAVVVPTRHEMWRRPEGRSQQAAFVKWLQLGGSAVISCAEHAEQLLRKDSPFGMVVPGTFVGVGFERQTTAIEEFVGGENRLNFVEANGASQLPYANLAETKGTILFSEGLGAGRHPAAVVAGVGLGNVVFVAFDLDSDTLAHWSGRTELVRRLLQSLLGPVDVDENSRPRMTQYGYDDIAGQLRMAMGVFPGVGVMPFSIVALLVAAYVLFIGPVDYLFLKRLSNRFEWTWLTFPVLVAAFCGLAYVCTKGQGSTSSQWNRVAVVDVDAESHHAIERSWWYTYSPASQRFDLSIKPNSDSLPVFEDYLMEWDGLAGTGFGGMNGGITAGQGRAPYEILMSRDGHRISSRVMGIPVDVRSSRSFYSQWTGKFNVDANQSTLRSGIENELEGDVVNSLPFTLDRCWLVSDRWVYKIGSLRPGQRKSMLGVTSRDLRSLLTQQEFVKSRYKTTPWDRDSTEIDDIMRMMMFFSAVRGEAYTGLQHRHQSRIDCSSILRHGRAMLVGVADRSPTKLMNATSELKVTQGATYFRLSIPIETKR